MDLVSLIAAFVVVGVVMWVINTYIPMEPRIKNLMNIVVIIFLVLYLLRGFGLLSSLHNIRL